MTCGEVQEFPETSKVLLVAIQILHVYCIIATVIHFRVASMQYWTALLYIEL